MSLLSSSSARDGSSSSSSSSAASVAAAAAVSAASVPTAIQGLYDSLLLCRPSNAILYSLIYFQCQQSDDPALAHAIHNCIFLVHPQATVDFENAACTIFLAKVREKNHQHRRHDVVIDGEILSTVFDEVIICAGWRKNVIIQSWIDRYAGSTGLIDLAQFVEVLRFPLWCYLAVQWVLLVCENIANEGQADVYMNALDMMTHISRKKEAGYPQGSNNNISPRFRTEDIRVWGDVLSKVLEKFELATVSIPLKGLSSEYIANEVVKELVARK